MLFNSTFLPFKTQYAVHQYYTKTCIAGCKNIKELVFEEGCEIAFNTGISSLVSVILPNTIKKIDFRAFWGCDSLRSITIPNSVTEIGWEAFERCSSLESINLPNSVTEIGEEAFKDCSSLTSINLPNSLTKIRKNVLCNCSRIESINIPNSVTKIEDYPFQNCKKLKDVTCLATTPPTIQYDSFYWIGDNPTLHVLPGCVEAYKNDKNWFQSFGEIVDDAHE